MDLDPQGMLWQGLLNLIQLLDFTIHTRLYSTQPRILTRVNSRMASHASIIVTYPMSSPVRHEINEGEGGLS